MVKDCVYSEGLPCQLLKLVLVVYVTQEQRIMKRHETAIVCFDYGVMDFVTILSKVQTISATIPNRQGFHPSVLIE